MANSLEFSLPENLTISHAHTLHDQLEALLETGSCEKLVMHAEHVSRADTAGMQLLLALMKVTKDRHIGLVWDQPSKKLIETAEVLGLRSALELH